MHFTIGELVVKLTQGYCFRPMSSGDSTAILRRCHEASRQQTHSRVASSWEEIHTAYMSNYHKMRKLCGMELLVEFRGIVSDETFQLLCKLYSIETRILDFADVTKFSVVYEEL